jgi:hypothetical protein
MNASISRFAPVLLVSLAVLAAGCSAGGSASPGPTVIVTAAPRGSSASSGPAPAASTGASTPSASSAPSGSGSAPVCATTQLALRIGGGLVSDGTDIYYLYFTNTSGTQCTLQGYPGVSLVTEPGNSGTQIGAAAQRTATSAPQLLKPGGVAQATLRIAKTGNFLSPQCQHVNALFLKIFPPGDTTAGYAGGIDEQVCAQPSLPTMTITTVVPDQ